MQADVTRVHTSQCDLGSLPYKVDLDRLFFMPPHVTANKKREIVIAGLQLCGRNFLVSLKFIFAEKLKQSK